MYHNFFCQIYFFVVYFIYFFFERERERAHVHKQERGTEKENLKQVSGFKLLAQSPTWGLNPQTARS